MKDRSKILFVRASAERALDGTVTSYVQVMQPRRPSVHVKTGDRYDLFNEVWERPGYDGNIYKLLSKRFAGHRFEVMQVSPEIQENKPPYRPLPVGNDELWYMGPGPSCKFIKLKEIR